MNQTDIRPLIAQLSQYSDFDGYVIAKAYYDIRHTSNDDTHTEDSSCDLLKQRTNYAILQAKRQLQSTQEQLTVHLLKPTAKPPQTDTSQSKPQTDVSDFPNVSFTQSEILSFVEQVNDYNAIHRCTNAVVPGLLILEWLLQILKPDDIFKQSPQSGYCLQIKYLHPLRAGEKLYLKRESTVPGVDAQSTSNATATDFCGINQTAAITYFSGICKPL